MRTQIGDLPMLTESPSAARISEYVCDLEYLFSTMEPRNPTCGLWVKLPHVRGKIAGLPPRGSDLLTRTMNWWTYSSNWHSGGRTTPIWKNFPRGTWIKVPASREGPTNYYPH